MTQKNHIRKMHFEQGMNISEISRETGFDRKTVRIYVEKDNWSEEPKLNPANKNKSILDPFKETIDSWLEIEYSQLEKEEIANNMEVEDIAKKIMSNTLDPLMN